MPETTVDVLVVDDNEDLLELATRKLRSAGISVVGAKDYQQLIEILAKTQVRLILMDVQMPDLFGDEVAATLRDGRGVKSKIVLHSSLDEEVLSELAKNAGVDGWIAKSAGIAHLLESVRKLLEP